MRFKEEGAEMEREERESNNSRRARRARLSSLEIERLTACARSAAGSRSPARV